MDTLPSSAQKGNLYTIYALAIPQKNITWKEIKYIGMSRNVQYRYSQHLSMHDKDQKDKTAWIESVLASGNQPFLCILEKDIEGERHAREREQYWIRYAMGQGAELFNRAITYTEEERLEAHQKRTAFYAEVEKLICQGKFVKRSVYWHPTSLVDRCMLVLRLDGQGHLREVIDMSYIDSLSYFLKDESGELVSVHDCSSALFDPFIKRYLPVVDGGSTEWTFEDKVEAINFAFAKGCQLDLVWQERIIKKSKKRRK